MVSTFNRLSNKLIYRWRDLGSFGLLTFALNKLLQHVFYQAQLDVYEYDLTDDLPALLLEGGFLDQEALLRLGYVKSVMFPNFVSERLKRGQKAYCLVIDGNLAHIDWVTEGYLNTGPDFSNYESDRVLGIYDCLTVPAYRRKGLYLDALQQLLIYARESGFERALIAVDPDNLASRNVIVKAGFSLFECVRISCICSKFRIKKVVRNTQ